MNISLESIYKRYTSEWIIRDFSYEFSTHSCIGINGINGSGKSTLIKIISGQLSPSKGTIQYFDEKKIARENIYQDVSLVAPYTDIIQEFTVEEMFDFHDKFKPMDIVFTDFVRDLDFHKHLNKRIGEYSSGMKQKVQLGLAMYGKSKILLLDEPTSYLDEINKTWFADRLEKIIGTKTIIIASNDDFDFQYCSEVIEL